MTPVFSRSTQRLAAALLALFLASPALAQSSSEPLSSLQPSAPSSAPESAIDEEQDPVAAALAALRDGSFTAEAASALTPAERGDVLSYVAASGDTEGLVLALKLGLAVDSPNSKGSNALISAIASGEANAVQVLARAGANPDASTAFGTPRAFAAAVASPEMQALVVNKGVIDTGAQVRLAARNNDKAELEALLRAGADPDAADPAGLTPLMDAVIGGAPDTLAALLDAKANFALKNLDGLTALAMAVMAENHSAAVALLAAGADPNLPVADTTLLALAALTGDAAMVELLLANKASPSLKDKEGNRPAAIAAAMGLTDIAKLLGGAPELVPVPDIFRAIDSGSAAEVKKAIEAGALKGNPRRDGWSPLAYAAATSTLPVTRLVYEADGAAWRQKGPDGTTVLAAALSHRNPSTARDIVGLLLDKVGYSGMADFLGQADNSSRSNLTLLALMAGPPPSDTIYAFRDGLSDALLHRSDNTGITPLIAAVLTKNIWFLQAVQAESLSMSASWNGTSLQDLARGRGDYLTLAFLPDDRPMPYGLKKGASKSVKMDLQQRLSDWGYYSGSIDGQFGPASRGAMIAFLKDREEELTAMSKAIGSAGVDRPDGFWTYDYGPDVDYDTLSFTVEKPSENCTWKFNRWRQRPGDNRTTTFMGCINANDDAWNADGVGYATYPSGSNELSLFGANGWNGEVDLR